MAEWNREYKNIGIILEDRIVRVLNDDALRAFLRSGKRYASYQLSQYIATAYQNRFHRPLEFSVKSLACEIYWHFYIKEKSASFEQKHGKKKLTDWLLRHMNIIDCGAGKIDNNRFLWDMLSLAFSIKQK